MCWPEELLCFLLILLVDAICWSKKASRRPLVDEAHLVVVLRDVHFDVAAMAVALLHVQQVAGLEAVEDASVGVFVVESHPEGDLFRYRFNWLLKV